MEASVKGAAIEQVFITWSQRCGVEQYVDQYLRSRQLAKNDAVRAAIHALLERYPGTAPHTKADLDFFLDRNRALYKQA